MAKSIYSPLDPSRKVIRLLLVESGSHAEDLTTRLVQADLDDADRPQYEAISYVWGDVSRRASLYVNECLTSVPETAVAALRCMRLVNETRVVWIDSICIDQTNL